MPRIHAPGAHTADADHRAELAVRLAGLAAILAGMAQLALFLGGGAGLGERPLIAAWNLLLVPAAVVLLGWLGRRAPLMVGAASAAGLASLLLWAGSAVWPELELQELAWIGGAAVWWVAIGLGLRRERRWLGYLTLATGIAAIGDFLVTVPESAGSPLPFVVFVLIGGWKIPLAVAWSLAVGAALVSRPPALGVVLVSAEPVATASR